MDHLLSNWVDRCRFSFRISSQSPTIIITRPIRLSNQEFLFLAAIHRIDRLTSGILMFARYMYLFYCLLCLVVLLVPRTLLLKSEKWLISVSPSFACLSVSISVSVSLSLCFFLSVSVLLPLSLFRTLSKAQEVESQVRERKIDKEYLCRVKGEFPRCVNSES